MECARLLKESEDACQSHSDRLDANFVASA